MIPTAAPALAAATGHPSLLSSPAVGIIIVIIIVIFIVIIVIVVVVIFIVILIVATNQL